MKQQNLSILDYMGKTPLVRLQNLLSDEMSDVYVKLEKYNPGESHKARIAYQMILSAEKKGLLIPKTGQTLIEPTGGNTGKGLAIVGAIRGYNVVLVVPDNYSKEAIRILKAYGAQVVLSDSTTGNDSHVRKAKEILNEHPDYIWLDQLSNPANPEAHYIGTGAEIAESLDKIDYFIAGIGSGGAISGTGKRIKETHPNAKIIAVQPTGCKVLEGKAVPHKIQGLAIGILPPNLNTEIVDEVISVDFVEAKEGMKLLAQREGLLVGISSGANAFVALNLAKKLGKGKKIVTLAPDTGRNYMEVFED